MVVEPSQGLNCATFTGQAPLDEATIVEGATNSEFQGEEFGGQIFTPVDIGHVDLEIQEGVGIPKLDCFTTSNPAAVVTAPTCSVFDQFGNQITTPRAGDYQIRCFGGTFSEGFSPNYKIGKLTVVTGQVRPTPSPSAVESTPSPSATPTASSPSATPTPIPTVQPTPTISQGAIDSSATLLPTGALQSCSTYSPIAVVIPEASEEISPTQSEGGEGMVYVPVEIRPAEYRLYENSQWPTFDCSIAQDPTKVSAPPLCFAFDGEVRLSSTPRPGSYEIRCQGVELLSGYTPLLRSAKLTVLALPRIVIPPSPAPSSAGPTPAQPSPSPEQSGNPRPTPTPSQSPSAPSIPKTAENIFELQSLDGQVKSVKILLPSLLLTRETTLSLDQSPSTSFIGDYLVVKPVITRSNSALNRYGQQIAITIPTPTTLDLVPVFSQDGRTWKEIEQISSSASSNEELGFVKSSTSSVTIYSQIAGVFALKARQSPLNLIITSTSSRYSPGATIQTSFTGGSGSGEILYESVTPLICSISSAGLVTAIKVGECIIQAQKKSDSRFMTISSGQVSIQILAQIQPTPSPSPSTKPTATPKPSPSASTAPVPVQKDFIIVIDSRVGINSRSSKLKWNQKNASLPLGKVIQLQVSGIDATAQYLVQLILPIGSSVPLTIAAQFNGNLVVQPIQLLKKGSYRLAIQKIGFNQTSITKLKVS